MIDPPQVVEAAAQQAAVIHVTVSPGEIRTVMGAAYRELMAWIDAEGRMPAAGFWEIYTAGPETGPDATQYRTELNRPLSHTRRAPRHDPSVR